MASTKEPKPQHCDICGAYIATYVKYHGDRDTCGSMECERDMRECERDEEAAREERAREDDYSRY